MVTRTVPKWDITFRPALDLSDREILDLLVHVEAHRQFAGKIPVPPSIAAKVDRLNLVRQIKGTTGIEGNTLSEKDIEEIVEEGELQTEDGSNTASSEDLEKIEVRNAARVHRYITQIATPGGDPVMVTEQLIRELHKITTQDCNYEANIPGRYRNHRVRAGDYIAPDHSELERLMGDFVEFINSREALEFKPLIRAIVAHFYLISIHPFGDGNGRTSRALEALILYQGGYNVRGFYSLASFYYRRREDYVAALQDARFKHQGRLQEFVRFSLRGFVEEIGKVQAELLEFVRAVMYKDYLDELYRSGEINLRCMSIASLLVEAGDGLRISVPEFRDRRHPVVDSLYSKIKSKRTILRDLEALKNHDLIKVDSDNIIRANVEVMNRFTG